MEYDGSVRWSIYNMNFDSLHTGTVAELAAPSNHCTISAILIHRTALAVVPWPLCLSQHHQINDGTATWNLRPIIDVWEHKPWGGYERIHFQAQCCRHLISLVGILTTTCLLPHLPVWWELTHSLLILQRTQKRKLLLRKMQWRMPTQLSWCSW